MRYSPFQAEPVKPTRIPMIVQVKRSTLLGALLDAGIEVPANASVTFRVPGGGDYSNTDVSLDEKEQIISIRYEREES